MRWKHRLTAIDVDRRIAVCSHCGPTKIRKSERYRDGVRCARHNIDRLNQRRYRKFLKDCCERCGFIPEHLSQLEIHHVDENHDNDEPTNLMTLCCNCHQLVTVMSSIHSAKARYRRWLELTTSEIASAV